MERDRGARSAEHQPKMGCTTGSLIVPEGSGLGLSTPTAHLPVATLGPQLCQPALLQPAFQQWPWADPGQSSEVPGGSPGWV